MRERALNLRWRHSDDSTSIHRAVTEMTEVYRTHGRSQLNILANYPAGFAHITPQALESSSDKLLAKFGSTIVRRALVFARIRQHEGYMPSAKAFAELGMKHLGMATGLRAKFRTFLGSPPNSR